MGTRRFAHASRALKIVELSWAFYLDMKIASEKRYWERKKSTESRGVPQCCHGFTFCHGSTFFSMKRFCDPRHVTLDPRLCTLDVSYRGPRPTYRPTYRSYSLHIDISTVGRQSVDMSVDISVDCRPIVGRYSTDISVAMHVGRCGW